MYFHKEPKLFQYNKIEFSRPHYEQYRNLLIFFSSYIVFKSLNQSELIKVNYLSLY